MDQDMSVVVATFYKFVSLPDFAQKQPLLQDFCGDRAIKGTILLAPEGVNGTIAGSREAIAAVLDFIKQDSRFADLEHKESTAATPPFDRLKVKLKREIVTLGQPQADPSQQVGTYVDPQDWNALITDPEVLVIDTRNDYEVSIGTFAHAQNPHTASFREFPDYAAQLDPAQHKKIAMFCTGGIRCEKASSYLVSQGFAEVYHLKGGILKYLEEIPATESLWQGECFVFDQRVAMQHGLEAGSHDSCLSCGAPVADRDRAAPGYEFGISCPRCIDSLTPEKRDRQLARLRSRAISTASSPSNP